jgi:hypothetical protein
MGAQLTAYETVAVSPDAIVTGRDAPSLTVQFAATPESVTVWLPAVTFVNEMLPVVAIAW